MRTIARSSSNSACASALASSVLPTPVGRGTGTSRWAGFGSWMPARERRIASHTRSTASSWPMTRSCRMLSRRRSFSRSPSISRATGMPVQRATMRANLLLRHAVAQVVRAVQLLLGAGLLLLELLLQLRQAAVLELRRAVEVVGALRALDLGVGALDLLAQVLHAADLLLLVLPLGLHLAEFGAQVGQLPSGSPRGARARAYRSPS